MRACRLRGSLPLTPYPVPLFGAAMRRFLLTTVLACAAAVPAVAQQGAFVIRLGRDTAAVERFTQTGGHIEGDAVVRQPRTTLRHFVFDFGPDGRPTRGELVQSRPGAAPNEPPISRS